MLGKVFKAYDVRATYPRPLNEKLAWQIGFGAAEHLLSEAVAAGRHDPMARHLVVGRDMRCSSPSLSAALCTGIRAAGGNVLDIGEVDTPCVYFAINHFDAAGGIQVTASHNPASYNGFKISGLAARPIGEGSGLEHIRRLAAIARPEKATGEGHEETRDVWSAYRTWLLDRLAPSIVEGTRTFKVVVDASNGMAGAMVPKVFGGVKGLELITLNLTMDGTFVHDPNPLVEKNVVPTQEAVRTHGADFGVCFDGDADRCVVVDETGTTVPCDLLLAWMVEGTLAHDAGAAIIYDIRSSRAVRSAIEAAGGRPVESRVGHVFMKAALAEHDAPLGGEVSGHFYFRDMFKADSGARAFIEVCNQLAADGGPLSDRITPHDTYARSGEINFEVDDTAVSIEALAERFKECERRDVDGMSLDGGEWWCNVRASNTEPLLRLNLEARDSQTLDEMMRVFEDVLGQPVDH
jgi:phosphomannomutase